MARIIRINTSSNKTPATKNPNPTQTREYNQDYYENWYAPHEPVDKKVIKVNSASRTTAGVTPKTSTVARLFRPSRGGGIGGIMGNKQR